MRKFIAFLLAVVILGAILPACGPAPTPAVVTVVVPQTVVKEATKEVTKEVTKVVTAVVTKEVVKVVTPTPVPPTPKPALKPGEVAREDTVIFDIDGGRVPDPTIHSPLLLTGWNGQAGKHQSMVEPLFVLNYETGEIQPYLCTAYEYSPDLKVWTLKVRKGVEWNDGKPFTARDIAFTINLLKANAGKVGNSSLAMDLWVEKVEALDDLTVRFTLKKPNPRFVLDYFSVKIWGSCNIVPEHIFKDVPNPAEFKFYDPAKGWPVFTGAYKLVKATETEFIYDRNDNWWGAKVGFAKLPQPKRLIWIWAGPEEARAAKMVEDMTDSLMDITGGTLLAIMAKNPSIFAWYDKLPYAWLDPCARDFEFNCMVKPWDDKEMRHAINYLINRDEIVNVAYEGTTFKSVSPFPMYPPMKKLVESIPEVYKKYPMEEFDQKKAFAIFEKKGYKRNPKSGFWEKDGKPLSINIEVHAGFIEKKKIAMVLVEQFQRAGVDAVMRIFEGAVWGTRFNMGDFEARAGWQSCGSVNEPWASLENYNCRWLMPIGERASNNCWRWCNKEFSDLVDQIGSLPLGDPKIQLLFARAMEILLDEMPVIYITQARKIIPFSDKYWTGWPSAKNNWIHPPTWWQHTHLIIQKLEKAK